MKKIFLAIIVMTMMLVLTACGKSKPYLGKWNYKIGSYDYSVELKEDNTYVMIQGSATRNGTYTVEEKDGYIKLALEYNKTYGYIKYQDDKMCALTKEDGDCDFYFEKATTTPALESK